MTRVVVLFLLGIVAALLIVGKLLTAYRDIEQLYDRIWPERKTTRTEKEKKND